MSLAPFESCDAAEAGGAEGIEAVVEGDAAYGGLRQLRDDCWVLLALCL